jgi:hypothetical protein
MVSSAVAGLRTLFALDGQPLKGAGSGSASEPGRRALPVDDTLHPAVTALRGALEALRR